MTRVLRYFTLLRKVQYDKTNQYDKEFDNSPTKQQQILLKTPQALQGNKAPQSFFKRIQALKLLFLRVF